MAQAVSVFIVGRSFLQWEMQILCQKNLFSFPLSFTKREKKMSATAQLSTQFA